MIKIVDLKCSDCNKVYTNEVEGDKPECECGGKLERLYSYNKYKEYPEGVYENFAPEGVYCKDRQDFYKKCKEYGVEPVIPRKEYRTKRKRGQLHFMGSK